MCDIAQTAARDGVRLTAIARPTQQREAGQAAGGPNFPSLFLHFKTLPFAARFLPAFFSSASLSTSPG